MDKSGSQPVQTELAEADYAALREVARDRGFTVTEAVYEALLDWIDRGRRVDPSDRAFTVLDDLEDVNLPEYAATDARSEDDLVEESVDAGSFTLSDDPSTR